MIEDGKNLAMLRKEIEELDWVCFNAIERTEEAKKQERRAFQDLEAANKSLVEFEKRLADQANELARQQKLVEEIKK